MQRILTVAIAVAAWLGAGGFAFAQEFNWTGFYVGANAGWLSGNFKGDFPLAPGFLFSPGRADQAVGGFYGGYQYQSGNWVIGAETGFDAALGKNFASRAATTGLAGTDCAYNSPEACEARLNNIFRVGGKFGWAFDRWLVYGVGGYAHGLVQARDNTHTIGIDDEASNYGDGWYAGAGVDFAIYKNLFFGVEYKHYDLGTVRVGSTSGGSGNPTLRSISATADSVMARLTIKIGP
jgi:outer membrane immunogenic protein